MSILYLEADIVSLHSYYWNTPIVALDAQDAQYIDEWSIWLDISILNQEGAAGC
ncbi:MAG: hypothetical protein PHV03_09100 [Desulfitobacteriaceae bacterium]|nr:hypothetical protein [Desulfitobacteriaceae bacterium]